MQPGDKDPLGILPAKTAPSGDPLGILPSKKKAEPITPAQPADPQQQQLAAYWQHLSPQEQQSLQTASVDRINHPDRIRAATKEEVEGQKAMDTTLGKVKKSLAYIGSETTKGGVQVLKGGAWVVNHLNTSLNDTQLIPDKAFKGIDKATDFGVTPGQKSQIEDSKDLGMGAARTLGMIGNIAPVALGGEYTNLPKTMFALQGIGQGKETMDTVDPEHKLNPAVRDLFIAGSGAVNGLIMGDLGENVLSKPVQDRIVSGIVSHAMQEAAEKGLTEDALKESAHAATKEFESAFHNYADKTGRTALDLSALQAAQYALKKGVDVSSDHPVFNENLGQLMSGISDVVTKQAPIFGGVGAMLGGAKEIPEERQKVDLGAQIKAKDAEIAQYGEKSDDPVKQAENEVNLERAEAEREALNHQLKSVILKQQVDEKGKQIAQISAQAPKEDAAGSEAQAIERAHEETTNNQITNPSDNEKGNNYAQKGQEEKGGEAAQESGQEGRQNEEGLLGATGAADPEEAAPASVKEIIGKPVKYKGEDAEVIQDGQTLVAKIKGSNKEYELGNVEEIGDKPVSELGIEHENSVVSVDDNGDINVRGKKLTNNFSDPLAAINRDKEGNVVSVNMETPDGKKRTFRGQIADDIAYQIHLKELDKNNTPQEKTEIGDLLKDHEVTLEDLDNEHIKSNQGSENTSPADADAKKVSAAHDDGHGNAGKDRTGATAETSKKQTEPQKPIAFSSEMDAHRHFIEHETNPNEIAAQWHQEPKEPDYIEHGIMNYLGTNGKINLSDYQKWGDKNNLEDKESPIRKWIDTKNSDRSGLDNHAQILSRKLGVEVKPQDFIDFVDKYKGRKHFEEEAKSELHRLLEERYHKLTGKNLTPAVAKKAYNKLKDESGNFKLAKLTTSELEKLNGPLAGLGFTYKDFQYYEKNKRDIEAEHHGYTRAAKSASNDVQRAGDDQVAGAAQDTGGKQVQGNESKPVENESAKKISLKEGSGSEHQKGDEGRKTTEASNSNSPVGAEKSKGFQKEVKAGDPLRKLADKIDAGKINKLGGFRAATGFDAVWDTSLSVVSASLRGGAKIADAIEEGLKHIRATDWYKNLTDKKDFDTKYQEHLAKELSDTQEAPKSKMLKATFGEIGVKKAIGDKLYEELGIRPLTLAKRISQEEGLGRGKELVDNGTMDPESIISRALAGKDNTGSLSFSRDEEYAMNYYERQLAEQRISIDKARQALEEHLEKNPEDEQAKNDLATVTQQSLNNRDATARRLHASQVMGNSTSASFNARKLATNEQGEILNSIGRIRDIYGNDIPDEVRKELSELQDKYESLLAKQAKIEEQLKKQQATKTIENVRPKRTIFGTKKRTEAEFKAAIKDVLADLQKDWKKASGLTYATIPGAPQFKALAPHVIKLLGLYAEQGISKLEDAINRIHDDIKEHAEGVTKDDIRDILAGKYSNKQPLSDLRKQLNDLRNQAGYKVKIDKLEKELVIKTKARGESSPAVQALQKELADLKKKILNEHAGASAEQLQKQAQSIQKKIDKGDFLKTPAVKRLWEKDPEWAKANKQKGDLQARLRKLESDALDSKKSKYMRGLDFTNRTFHRVLFFMNNAVFAHLGGSALFGSILNRPFEFIIGKGLDKAFPEVAKNAPIEGNINLHNEGQWYARLFNLKQTAKNTLSIAKTGDTDLSRELSMRPHQNHIPYLEALFAGGHAIIKDPIRESAYYAAFDRHMDWYAENGLDGTHPFLLEQARQAAWQRAEYEIFQNNSKLAKLVGEKFKQAAREGLELNQSDDPYSVLKGNLLYTADALYQSVVPVNTVPSNIIERGLLPFKLPTNIFKAINENNRLKKGISSLTNAERDALFVQMKKGSVGAFYWTLGVFLAGKAAGGLYTRIYPDKTRDEKTGDPDSNYLELLGQDIGKDWQHSYQFRSLQQGATYGLVKNHFLNDTQDDLSTAIIKGSLGMSGTIVNDIPTVRFYNDLHEAMTTPGGEKRFVKGLKERYGVKKASDLFKAMGYTPLDDDE